MTCQPLFWWIITCGLQVKAKFKNVKAQYMKKLKSIERSGANPHDWTYYPYLEPYFRGNKQVTPDNEECSEDVSSQQFRFPRKRSRTTTSETEGGRDKRMKLLLTQLERTNGVMEQLLQLRTLQFQFQQTQASTHQQHQYNYQPPPGHYYQPPVYVSTGYTTTYSPTTPQQQCPNGTGSSAPGAADLMI